MQPLTPPWIPQETMEYIHQKHGEHISRQDLLDVMYREPVNLDTRKAAVHHRADLLIKGKSHGGKRLLICVVVDDARIKQVANELGLSGDPGDYASLVYNAWEWSIMNERMIEELREESEKLHRQLEENPETWEELEEVSEEILPPEVSHLVVDFKKGQFDYQDYFRLSTEHRNLFRQYLKEHLGVKLTIEKPA